jgi:hypothetical protein
MVGSYIQIVNEKFLHFKKKLLTGEPVPKLFDCALTRTVLEQAQVFFYEVLLLYPPNCPQCRLDDKKDEQVLILEQSKSGQHISSKYLQSRCGRIEQEIESLKSIAEEVEREIENRKN